MPQTTASERKVLAALHDAADDGLPWSDFHNITGLRAGTNPLQPDTRTPIKLELDADEMRRDASYRLHMAKHGYCNPDHPGDLELKARWEREARELIASAERNESRAKSIRAAAKMDRAA